MFCVLCATSWFAEGVTQIGKTKITISSVSSAFTPDSAEPTPPPAEIWIRSLEWPSTRVKHVAPPFITFDLAGQTTARQQLRHLIGEDHHSSPLSLNVTHGLGMSNFRAISRPVIVLIRAAGHQCKGDHWVNSWGRAANN